MSEPDDRLPEQFLVDGVAPSVIGGDPQAETDQGMDQEPEYRDPPTAPIPAAERAPHKPKKSLFSRVFSPRSSR